MNLSEENIDNIVKVSINSEPYKTIVKSGKHVIVSDEPFAEGGQNEGMTPFQLLLSSLGSCICITLRMYADRKSWPLESVNVDLFYEFNLQNKTKLIVTNVEIKGRLDHIQIERLKEISEKCPIHKMLSNGIDIRTNLIS